MDMTNQRGRPPVPPEEAIANRLSIRVKTDELEAWKAASDTAGQRFSEWVRRVLNRAAKKPK